MSDRILDVIPPGPHKVVPGHYLGPAVIEGGTLIDWCPSVDSAIRIACALNELESAPLEWALPHVQNLEGLETERVIRALAKKLRYR